MTLRIVVAIALLLTLPAAAAVSLTDTDIARVSHQLLVAAGAIDSVERAAFIVRSPAGQLDLVLWPGGTYFSARWNGPMPEGVVAVIHTHPAGRPTPSARDRVEAKRVGLPFYVVSRAALCVADSTGNVSCARRIPWLQRNGMERNAELDWTARSVVRPS